MGNDDESHQPLSATSLWVWKFIDAILAYHCLVIHRIENLCQKVQWFENHQSLCFKTCSRQQFASNLLTIFENTIIICVNNWWENCIWYEFGEVLLIWFCCHLELKSKSFLFHRLLYYLLSQFTTSLFHTLTLNAIHVTNAIVDSFSFIIWFVCLRSVNKQFAQIIINHLIKRSTYGFPLVSCF